MPHTDANRGGLHQLLHSLRRDWPRLTLDVLVLILGISISFWIEKRRSSLGDRKKERYALAGLLPNGAFGPMVRFTAADYRSLASSPPFLKLILRQQYIKIRQGQRYGAALTEMRALITSLDEELAKQ